LIPNDIYLLSDECPQRVRNPCSRQGSDRCHPWRYVQFLRVEETALADPVLYAESIAGPLPERIAKLEGNTESQIR